MQTAKQCDTLQQTSTHTIATSMHRTATPYKILQHTAAHVQHTRNPHSTYATPAADTAQRALHLDTICTTLHHTAAHMQHPASPQHTCNTLQQHTCNTCNRLSRTRTSSSTRSANGFSALDDVRVCVCVFGCPIGDVGVSRLTNEGNTVFDMEDGVVE